MATVVVITPSYSDPCELVRRTCRQWMVNTGGLLPHTDNNNDDHDDDVNSRNRSRSANSDNVVQRQTLVRFRHDKLSALAKEIVQSIRDKEEEETTTTTTTMLVTSSESLPGTSNTNNTNNDDNNNTWIEWDSEGWHYNGVGFQGTAQQRRERIGLYLLALDAINFCFWPYPETDDDDTDGGWNTNNSTGEGQPKQQRKNNNNPLEYEHLALALKGLAEADHNDSINNNNNDDNVNTNYAFAPHNMAQMTPTRMKGLLGPYLDQTKYPIPNIEKRSDLWREVGEVLIRDYNGSVIELLQQSDMDASMLVEHVATSFPGFRDEVVIFDPPVHSSETTTTITAAAAAETLTQVNEQQQQRKQRRIVFLKRAQIFVGDINAALGLQLRGMDRLTTFADYRVPQILRHWDILQYAPDLAHMVDDGIEIPAGSVEEISIRAATVVAVEELVKFLNDDKNRENDNTTTTTTMDGNSRTFTDVNVDWYLWQVGERMHQQSLMKPFHKVKTHFY